MIQLKRRGVFTCSLLMLVVLTHGAMAADASYVYDEQGRVKRIYYANGTGVYYTYDAAGNRTQVVTGSHNSSPTPANDSVTTTFNAAVTFNPLTNDSDPNGDNFYLVSVGAPSHGAASTNGTTITYAPTSGYSGADSFVYTIADGNGGQGSATVYVSVQTQISVSLTNYSYLYTKPVSGAAYTSPSTISVSASGGTGSLSYSWEKVSGDEGITVKAGYSSSGTTIAWSDPTLEAGATHTSTWRCKVTDSTGNFAYSANVSVTFQDLRDPN